MDLGIRGKVAFVSGGSKGMGRTTAELFAKEGCRVAIAALHKDQESIDETVKAIVVRSPGASDDDEGLAADIIAATRGRLAHYKCPTSIDFIDVLPRNPSGKVLKRELRRPYWGDRERNIH